MAFELKLEDQGGRYLFLKDGDDVTVKLIEDLGKRPKMGQYAKNEKGEQAYEEAFRIIHDGRDVIMTGPWRLRRAIREGLKDCEDPEPTVNIKVSKGMETLKNGRKMEVKQYVVNSVLPF